MDYIIKRSKRKTIAIYIKNGQVEVRAPLGCPMAAIEGFVEEKQGWISGKLATSQEQAAARRDFALGYGDFITLRGRQYPIVARAGDRAGFCGESFYMPSGLAVDAIRDICIKLYHRLAKSHIEERIAAYAAKLGSPATVKINSAKTRWGSCSARKSINFSWRLIMAADPIIDYVVVHELAHMQEMNHSPRFWAIIEKIMPDYYLHRQGLKKLQKRLASEDW
ncbi:MAG: M48 family metallopeptidase [Defluviitaleaceae bacterium]|nr:M48 family metallopeptidase [Defluviitaleaceae bacterium]